VQPFVYAVVRWQGSRVTEILVALDARWAAFPRAQATSHIARSKPFRIE
jgi:hypothetical protein